MINIINWLKANTPNARCERMIRKAKEEEYFKTADWCRTTNIRIMETLLQECPEDHLIVLERTCGWPGVSFEESKADLVASMKPEISFCSERGTCRMCFNPKICKNNAIWMVRQFSHLSLYHDIIVKWEFVPFPKEWNQ